VTHHLFDTHPDDLRDLWLNNRDSLVRHTDSLIETLQQFRDVLAADDHDAVEAALVDAADRYTGWLSRRVSGKWDQEDAPRASSTESLMSGLMGGYLAKRLLGDRDKNSKR
jgi:hypothetical protein